MLRDFLNSLRSGDLYLPNSELQSDPDLLTTQNSELKTALLIPQAFNGIEAGCFAGRPDAEEQSDCDGDREPCGNGPEGYRGGERWYEEHDDLAGGGGEQDSHETAEKGQCHRLAEKLGGDIASASAHSFTNANLRR